MEQSYRQKRSTYLHSSFSSRFLWLLKVYMCMCFFHPVLPASTSQRLTFSTLILSLTRPRKILQICVEDFSFVLFALPRNLVLAVLLGLCRYLFVTVFFYFTWFDKSSLFPVLSYSIKLTFVLFYWGILISFYISCKSEYKRTSFAIDNLKKFFP